MKGKAKLQIYWLSAEGVPQHTHTEPLNKYWETYWSQAFKEITVQLLADH